MLVDYWDITKQILASDVSKFKKDVMKDKGDSLTELEKRIYSEDRLPLITHLVVGDIVVELRTSKQEDAFITIVGLTDGDPILMNSYTKVNHGVVLNTTEDLFEALNTHEMFTSLICKINREQLKKFPQIKNITNI